VKSHADNSLITEECILEMCRHIDPKEARKAAMLIWTLWNNWVWNHEKEHGQQLGYKALSFWYEWDVQMVYSSGVQQQQTVLAATNWREIQM
jgi:hypothetical protein